MSGKRFLYGTHYSAPGYVLYYLARQAPVYLLCLQNGKFDQPNRLFHCIANTWKNVKTDHADVKELIPEFYQPPGDFLLNVMGLDFGVRTDGVRVSDVVVPPWANDANDFTKKCLEALECDYVSERLNQWIDLIFGYKQQGREALKANNLFHYLTYEGSVNLDYVHDPEALAAIELQIKEFGQTPRQLFNSPHPVRLVRTVTKTTGGSTQGLATTVDNSSSNSSKDQDLLDWVYVSPQESQGSPQESQDGPQHGSAVAGLEEKEHLSEEAPKRKHFEGAQQGIRLKLEDTIRIHRDAISAVKFSQDGRIVFSTSQDKTLKVHMLEDKELLRSATVSNLPLSSLAVLPGSKVVLVGSWDNNMYTYSVEYGAVTNSHYAHDSSVTSLCWRENTLATGSWDSTVKVWQLDFDLSVSKPSVPVLVCELDHDNEVTCLDIDRSVARLVSGVVDGFVAIWTVPDGYKEFEYQAHNDAVNAVLFSPDGAQVCSCGGDGVVKLFEVETKTEVIFKRSLDIFRCMTWSGDHLMLGSESGNLCVWNCSTLLEVFCVDSQNGPITCLDVSGDGKVVVTGSKEKALMIWTLS